MSHRYPSRIVRESHISPYSARSPITILQEPADAYPVPRPHGRLLLQAGRWLLFGALGGLIVHYAEDWKPHFSPTNTVSGPAIEQLPAETRKAFLSLLQAQEEQSRKRKGLEQELRQLRDEQLRELERHNRRLEQELQASRAAREQAERSAHSHALAQVAAERIAGQYGGGRNITGVPLVENASSCNGGNCAIPMRASWNGAWIATNYYWVEGMLYVDEQGRTKFQEHERSQSLVNLSPAGDSNGAVPATEQF